MISNLLKNKLSLLVILFSIFSLGSYAQEDTELLVVEDTYVSQKDPGNHDGETDMGVAIDDTNGDTRETYLKFDLTELYGKGGIASVTLEISTAQKIDAGWVGIPDLYVYLYGCNEPWQETSINWANKPESDTIVLAEANVNAHKYYQMTYPLSDDTSLVAYVSKAMARKDQFISFVVKGKEETAGSRIWISDKGWQPARLIVDQDPGIPEPGGEDRVDVTDIKVETQGGVTGIATDDGTLQMTVVVLPEDATFKTVKWTVENGTGKASISKTGLVKASENGTVTIVATSTDGNFIMGEYDLTISNQVDKINLITAGEFNDESDLGFWNISVGDGIGQQPIVADGHVSLPVENQGDYWNYQLGQDSLDAKTGIPYIFTFVAWADVAREMIVNFEDPSNGYERYGTSTDEEAQGGRCDWKFNLTTEPKRYVFHVTFSEDMVKPNTNQLLVFQAASAVGTVHIDSITLIKESIYTSAKPQASVNSLKIYPNPAQSVVMFSEKVENVVVRNILGHEIRRYQQVSGKSIDVAGIAPGIYIITAQGADGKTATAKIVKH